MARSSALPSVSRILRQTSIHPEFHVLPVRPSSSILRSRTYSSIARSQSVLFAPKCFPAAIRSFQTTSQTRSLMPQSENPPPPEPESTERNLQATELSDDEYHQRADEYLEDLVERLEEMQEKSSEVEVEYAAGVLEVSIANKGSYVLNKQPPNKQIWLSSPISGPKRFDWVVQGESMESKQDTGAGSWIYLRDGSSLEEILRKEIGVDVAVVE